MFYEKIVRIVPGVALVAGVVAGGKKGPLSLVGLAVGVAAAVSFYLFFKDMSGLRHMSLPDDPRRCRRFLSQTYLLVLLGAVVGAVLGSYLYAAYRSDAATTAGTPMRMLITAVIAVGGTSGFLAGIIGMVPAWHLRRRAASSNEAGMPHDPL